MRRPAPWGASVLLLAGLRGAWAAPAAVAVSSAQPASLKIPVPPAEAPLIAQVVARDLEEKHYSHHPITPAVSAYFLENYLRFYDYNRMVFLASDVDRLKARYGKTLGSLLKDGDVSPAYEIFGLFLRRLKDRLEWAEKVAQSSVTFTRRETVVLDRHKLPWPSTPAQARAIWEGRIKYDILQERLSGTKPEKAAGDIRRQYERLWRGYLEYEGADILEDYLTALTHSFDPHSDYMGPPRRDTFNIEMGLSLVGIGAVLSAEDGYAKVVRLIPGGPADKDKRLKANDKIEAVAQGDAPFVSVVGMRLDHVVEMIRGEKGTLVRLRVIPAGGAGAGGAQEIDLVRDKIKLVDREAKARIIALPRAGGQPPLRVGVITLPSFYLDMKSMLRPKSSVRDVKTLLEFLEERAIQGLVLDLRNNGGGSLPESVSMAGLFIPRGPMVQVKDERGEVRLLWSNRSRPLYAGPMAVLTNRASASASEIMAAALQDYGRAVVVGEKSTFGKGTVQSVIGLAQEIPSRYRPPRAGALKLTIQKFYRISGNSTQLKGVIPDLRLPAVADYMEFTEDSLPHALPYDRIAPVQHGVFTGMAPILPDLEARSRARVEKSADFGIVREEIRRYLERKENKAVSIEMAERVKEREKDEAWKKKEDLVWAAHRRPYLSSPDITLEQIDSNSSFNPVLSSATANSDGASASAKVSSAAVSAPDLDLEESVRVVADIVELEAAKGVVKSGR